MNTNQNLSSARVEANRPSHANETGKPNKHAITPGSDNERLAIAIWGENWSEVACGNTQDEADALFQASLSAQDGKGQTDSRENKKQPLTLQEHKHK